jgi:hypothetical protein
VHEFDTFEYQLHTQYPMIDFATRPDVSEALYQPGQKILPPRNHLFGNPRQGTNPPDFMNSTPVETPTVSISVFSRLASRTSPVRALQASKCPTRTGMISQIRDADPGWGVTYPMASGA